MASRIITDVKLLSKALKIGHLLGIFPRISSKHQVVWYVYSFVLGAIFFVCYTGLLIYYQAEYDNITNMDIFLDYVDVFMLIVFNIIFLRTSLKQRKRLDKLLNNLTKMDRLLLPRASNSARGNRLFYFLAFLATVLWILVVLFSCINPHYIVWYVSFLVFDTYNVVWIYCLHLICSLIRSSFINLEEFIKEHFPEANPANSRLVVANVRICKQSPAFKQIVKINVLIEDSVRITNSIFGGMVLTLFCKGLLNIINAFNYQLFLANKNRSITERVMDAPYIFQSVLLLTFAIIVIRACDDVQNAHVELVTACRKRLAHMEDGFLSKELIVLSAYMENLPPNFTAAGFFRITKGLLSSFSSTLLSYLIVILQFKMGSKNLQVEEDKTICCK